jgi:hypothetical protein
LCFGGFQEDSEEIKKNEEEERKTLVKREKDGRFVCVLIALPVSLSF